MENNVEPFVKKKKGRPRKIVAENDSKSNDNSTDIVVEKKKRGRKKKEPIEEVVKQKKKRGRKAAVKFFSSSIRKRIPLTTVIQDNDKSILHLDIKDTDFDSKKELYNLIEDYDNITATGYRDQNCLNTECSIDTSNKPLLDANSSDFHEDKILYDKILEDYPLIELYEKRLQTRIAQDNKLIERLENIHNDEELLEELQNNNLLNFDNQDHLNSVSKESDMNKLINLHNGYFNVLNDFIENNEWLEHTDVCCWWCCHQFNTIPIGLPVDYDKNKSKKFIVKGVFCSFACMIAYGYNDKKRVDENFKALTSFLYKKITGGLQISSKESYRNSLSVLLKDSLFGNPDDLNTKLIKEDYINNLVNLADDPLKPAPPRCTLKMFGGKLSIDEFRNSTRERKVYKMVEYPMSISRDYVEEVDLENIKHINMNVFSNDKKKELDKRNNNTEELKLHEIRMDNAKNRITSTNNVITNNNINKFITF